MIGSGRDLKWCQYGDTHAKQWNEQQANEATRVAPKTMTPAARAKKWAEAVDIKVAQTSWKFMLLGIDFTCTEEFQQQIILLHKGKLTKKQREIKDSVTRNEAEPPSNRVGKISQLLEDEMPTEVIAHMFNREDIAASSNRPAGFDQVPDYMYKASLNQK